MQVILKKDILNVGRMGELVKVKTGYARNYLIPRSFAVAANPSNVESFEHHKKLIEIQKKKVQKESEVLAEKVKTVKITLTRKFNEAGKMFGSLTNAELAQELAKAGYVVDRRDIEFEGVKSAGEYSVRVRLPGDVYCNISLNVKAEVEKTTAKAAKAAKKPRAKKSAEGEEATEATEASESEETDSKE